MDICFYNLNLDHPQINTTFGGMYRSFWQALKEKNVDVNFTTSPYRLNADVIVVPLVEGHESRAAKAMIQYKGPVILHVTPSNTFFYREFLKRWAKRILFAYGTDFSDLTFSKYKSLQIPYYHLPFASDETIFKPLNLSKLYDIIFVGNANSGIGRLKYIDLLIKTAKKKNWEILLLGYGWAKYGYPYQIIAHGKLLNLIYNTGRICLNLHNDIQYSGQKIQMDANNRAFDLAMAGCFQINNATDLIAKYFAKDEVVAMDDPLLWIQTIEYYLNNNSEMTRISQKAREKALVNHTWHKRAEEFHKMIEDNISEYYSRNQNINLLTKYSRIMDQYIVPLYKIKKIRILKKILKLK